MPSGRAAKNASMPAKVGSSMALRLSGRASESTAIGSRRSAGSDRGNSTSKPLADLAELTAIPGSMVGRAFGDISGNSGQALAPLFAAQVARAAAAFALLKRRHLTPPGMIRK